MLLINLLLILTGTSLGAYVYLQQPQHAQLRAELMSHVEHVHAHASAHYHAIVGDRIAPILHSVSDCVRPYFQAACEYMAPHLDALTTTVTTGLHSTADALAPWVLQASNMLQDVWLTLQHTLQPLTAELGYRSGQLSQWCILQWQHVSQFFTTVCHGVAQVCAQVCGHCHCLRGPCARSSWGPTSSRAWSVRSRIGSQSCRLCSQVLWQRTNHPRHVHTPPCCLAFLGGGFGFLKPQAVT